MLLNQFDAALNLQKQILSAIIHSLLVLRLLFTSVSLAAERCIMFTS